MCLLCSELFFVISVTTEATFWTAFCGVLPTVGDSKRAVSVPRNFLRSLTWRYTITVIITVLVFILVD